jgi:hypothetical protein
VIKTWHEGMTDKETADLAYWERNMLALRYAEGWHNDDVPELMPLASAFLGAPLTATRPRFPGWRRVLTLDDGRITFHIPDDFGVGDLPEVEPNWDGHTTEEKWSRIMSARGVK